MLKMDYSEIQPIIDLHTCIQGEGMKVGVPHILIRTSGCNLRCTFKGSICDTAYSSWNPEKGKYSLNDVVDIIIMNPQIKCMLITGGEPTLHPELLKSLIAIGRAHGLSISMETNGTIPRSDVLDGDTYVDVVSISPKLKSSVPSSGEFAEKHAKTRENIPAIVSWIMESKFSQLKYVVSSEDDIKEVERQVRKIKKEVTNLDPFQPLIVYLMPEGDTEEKLAEKRKWLAQRCIDLGYFYSDRLHIIIFGDKRDA